VLSVTGTGRRIAAVCLAGGVIAAAVVTTTGATASTTPTISVTVSSKLRKVSGHVFVVYKQKGADVATIRVGVTGPGAGEVVRIYAQRFPYTAKPVPVTSHTLSGGTDATLVARDTPTLATRYTAAVFSDGAATTPLASSAAATVYVAAQARTSRIRKCRRPVCRHRVHIRFLVPASALRAEMAKRQYLYFGISRARRREPRPPRWLRLGAGHGRVSRPRRLSADEFEVSVHYRFWIGDEGYFWVWTACAKDSEAADGVNLPGSHGCGQRKIGSTGNYLG
jgi:hypothetical protein